MIDWWGPVFYDAYGATEVGTTCSIASADGSSIRVRSAGRSRRSRPSCSTTTARRCRPTPRVGCTSRTRPGAASSTRATPRRPPRPTSPRRVHAGRDRLRRSEGFVYITDRFSDMMVSGGVNIYPAEAEQVLIEHPAVADVACIGVPHAEMGEQMKALVVPVDPADPPDRRRADGVVPDRLGRLQVPADGRLRRRSGPQRRWARSTSGSYAGRTGSSALVGRRSRRRTPYVAGRSGRDPCLMSDVRPHTAHRSSCRRGRLPICRRRALPRPD